MRFYRYPRPRLVWLPYHYCPTLWRLRLVWGVASSPFCGAWTVMCFYAPGRRWWLS